MSDVYETLLYAVEDKVATVTLNRPDRLNAWTNRMAKEYRHAMGQAEHDEAVRVIVVTGAGRGWCAGADMDMLSSISEGEQGGDLGPLPFVTPGSEHHPRPDLQQDNSWPLAVRKPIIAAINGPVAGIGLVHALYCDIRIAAEGAKFTTAFARRGLVAEHGIAYMLPRLIGTAHALDLLLSGRTFLADEALAMGLVNRVVSKDELLPTVYAYAKDIATNASPRSQSIMKWQVYEAMFQNLEEAPELANTEMLKSFSSEDFKEGVSSFVERRPPNFTGR